MAAQDMAWSRGRILSGGGGALSNRHYSRRNKSGKIQLDCLLSWKNRARMKRTQFIPKWPTYHDFELAIIKREVTLFHFPFQLYMECRSGLCTMTDKKRRKMGKEHKESPPEWWNYDGERKWSKTPAQDKRYVIQRRPSLRRTNSAKRVCKMRN